MKFSKIGSNTTYHRCVKELSHWKYILYKPSHNPFKSSKVQLFNFSTSDKQEVDLDSTINGQALVSNININKHNIDINKPLSIKEVLNFFKKKNWSENEAEKFFSYYEPVGWKKGNSSIENWQAAAESWILKAEAINLSVRAQSRTNNESNLPLDYFQDNLHTNQNKNYEITTTHKNRRNLKIPNRRNKNLHRSLPFRKNKNLPQYQRPFVIWKKLQNLQRRRTTTFQTMQKNATY